MKKLSIPLFIFLMLCVPAAFAQSAWNFSTKTSIDGKVTETAISESNDAAALVIRCKTSCEIYISLDRTIAADQDSVRVKFNDKLPLKTFAVNRGEGSDSLFFRAPISVLKAMRDNGGYMTIEYRPYERTATTATFGIWNIPPTILKRIK
jgi:hypothetical protein